MSKQQNNPTAPAEETVTTVAEVEQIVFPVLRMEVCGKGTSLLPTQYKPRGGADKFDDTKRYWCFREPTRRDGSFGVQVRPLAESLPSTIVIDGVTVGLDKGLTASSWTDRKSGQHVEVAESERRPLVAFNGLQHLPTIGRVCNVVVTISVTQYGQWNIKAIVSIPESAEEREARLTAEAAARAAENDALFDAMFD